MLKGIIIMAKLENVHIRKVLKNNTSKTVTIPRDWAEVGEKVCVTVSDENTLIISKKLGGYDE